MSIENQQSHSQEQSKLIEKLTSEDSKLALYLHEFQQALQRKNSKKKEAEHEEIDYQRLQKQLDKEVDCAKVILKNYQNELRAVHKKSAKNRSSAEELASYEETIRKKESQLREIESDIKNMTLTKRKQQKAILSKEKSHEECNKMTKITEQIRKQKEQLEAIATRNHQASEALQKRKAMVAELELSYLERGKKYQEKVVSFEEFKEKMSQKYREESANKISTTTAVLTRKDPKKIITVREIRNSHLQAASFEANDKNLQELKDKLYVAENSLKIARKKHEKQIDELNAKIKSLQQESETLQLKYLDKKKEKEAVEKSRAQELKKSSRTTAKLEPIK